MHSLKPLPLFEEFLNQQEDQQGEMIFLSKEQLQGVKITQDTKFTGAGSTFAPLKEKEWLPEGEYEIGEMDNEFVRLTGNDNIYWIARYDFEEAKSTFVSPIEASATDALSDAKDALNAVASSKAAQAPYGFQTFKPA